MKIKRKCFELNGHLKVGLYQRATELLNSEPYKKLVQAYYNTFTSLTAVHKLTKWT